MLPDRSLKGLFVKNGKHFNYLFGFFVICVHYMFKEKKQVLWTFRKLYH